MMKLVIIVLVAYSIVSSATDYYKYKLLKKMKRELEKLRAKHSILYNNIKDAHGLCEARRLSRPRANRDAQIFTIERIEAPQGEKSIEVL